MPEHSRDSSRPLRCIPTTGRLGRQEPRRRLFEDPHHGDHRGHQAGSETHSCAGAAARRQLRDARGDQLRRQPGSRDFAHRLSAAVLAVASQRAAGQKWVRCDIGVQATTQCCAPLAPQTASLRGKVGADQGRYQICISELPDPARNQRLTSCKQPHRAELLPTPLELNPAKYPPAAVLERTGRSGCADMVKDRKDAEGLVVAAHWDPKSQWSGGTLFAQCWITRKTGLLPPIE